MHQSKKLVKAFTILLLNLIANAMMFINVVLFCVVKEPKLPGFCFDGFPATLGQAAEFEKLLTGYDFFFWKHFAAAASKLAPPPIPVTMLLPYFFECKSFNP